MIKNGLKPKWSDRRDYDFIKTHLYGAVGKPTEYREFSVDAGFPMMNQNSMALPYGCTGFAQADLCSNEDGLIYDPAFIYYNTPPGGAGGRDMRKSLSFICNNDLREYLKTGVVSSSKRTGYFSIRAQGVLDWFDAIYVSLLSTLSEKRGATIGLPWFPIFESVGKNGILPMPAGLNTGGVEWHNATIGQLKVINGVPYLGIKSWQGPEYGDNGWCYMSKELANAVFEINGTEVFTVSKVTKGQVSTIDLTFIESIVSFISNLISKMTPTPPTDPVPPPTPKPTPDTTPTPVETLYKWDTPVDARHSVRVICDEEGLTLEQKNTLCATIGCESGWKNSAKLENKGNDGKTWSTDWGICQINDYWNIGKGKPFPSVEYVLNNPDKVVRWMCAQWKANQRNLWVCYSKGGYKNYL